MIFGLTPEKLELVLAVNSANIGSLESCQFARALLALCHVLHVGSFRGALWTTMLFLLAVGIMQESRSSIQ